VSTCAQVGIGEGALPAAQMVTPRSSAHGDRPSARPHEVPDGRWPDGPERPPRTIKQIGDQAIDRVISAGVRESPTHGGVERGVGGSVMARST